MKDRPKLPSKVLAEAQAILNRAARRLLNERLQHEETERITALGVNPDRYAKNAVRRAATSAERAAAKFERETGLEAPPALQALRAATASLRDSSLTSDH